jgi:hypothetical protein
MAIGAVLAAFLAVLVGVLLLAEVANLAVVRRLKVAHVTLALIATLVVCGAGIAKSAAPAWAAAVTLLAAGSVGLATWRRSLVVPTDKRHGAPPVLLVVHGLAALTTLALILVVAIQR